MSTKFFVFVLLSRIYQSNGDAQRDRGQPIIDYFINNPPPADEFQYPKFLFYVAECHYSMGDNANISIANQYVAAGLNSSHGNATVGFVDYSLMDVYLRYNHLMPASLISNTLPQASIK